MKSALSKLAADLVALWKNSVIQEHSQCQSMSDQLVSKVSNARVSAKPKSCVFACEFDSCEYKTHRNDLLKSHLKAIHYKIKDISCSLCDYRCSQKSNLTVHMKSVHHKTYDFSCLQCDYKTNNKTNLRGHVKVVHDKIRDYACAQCSFKCALLGVLNKHMKEVHDKIRNFPCQQCDHRFITRYKLNRHVKAVHDKIKKKSKVEISDDISEGKDEKNPLVLGTNNSDDTLYVCLLRS